MNPELTAIVTALDNAIKNLECQKAEDLLAKLNNISMTPDVLDKIFKTLQVNSMGALQRRVSEWCFKARRNKDYLISKLTEYGFKKENIYFPKVIYNADKLKVIIQEDNPDIIIVKCIKDGMKDFDFQFDRSQLIYLFKKFNRDD